MPKETMDSAQTSLTGYQGWLRQRLRVLAPVFAKAAVGDFSADVKIPEDEDELTEFMVGVQIMLDTIREKVSELEAAVHESQAAQEIIANEKARVQAILDSVDNGLVVVDETRHITYINEPAIALFGEASRILGQDSAAVVRLEDEAGRGVTAEHHPIVASLKRGRRASHNLTKGSAYYVLRPDGRRRRLGLTITPIMHGKQLKGAAIMLRDITDESNMDRAKSEIVSIASHQLRTPLTAIRWYAKTLLDAKGLTAEQHTKYLQQIYDSNQHMVMLVDALLNVSRIELGTMLLRPAEVSLVQVVGEVVRELAVEARIRDVALTVSANRQLKPVLADPNAVQIILQNLISNAIKYSAKHKEVIVALQQQDGKALIEVSNHGPGIPQAEQDKIFTKLFRASNAQRQAPDGFGLGLYVTKELVEHSQGRIWFQSVEDHGSTFYVELPSKVA